MKPSVLIVDSSLTVRMDLDEALSAAGFAVTQCATAAAVRAALSVGSFHLIVLDTMLPDADGIELLAELKRTPGTAVIPVMLLATESEVRDRMDSLHTGADEYVGKPYDRDDLVNRAHDLARRTLSTPAGPISDIVLVIDGSPSFRSALGEALESAGYRVLTAATGEEALALAAAIPPGAVVVNERLPGIDGPTVLRRLRADASLRHAPCLLLTVSERHSEEWLAQDVGANVFVCKDRNPAAILNRLAVLQRTISTPVATGATASSKGRKKILAVDDSPTFLHELATRLRHEGYDVLQVSSGQAALEVLTRQPVDCILLDLVMPGLSGKEVCRRIKETPGWRDIPLIMVTAHESPEAVIEGIDAGADDFIAKSSDFEVINARLRAQLRRKQFEDENRLIREQLRQREREAAVAETRAALLADLERKNQELAQANEELEAFSYSVSHDLRAPLRAIDGFTRMLLEDYADRLDAQGLDALRELRSAALRMTERIEGLLALSRWSRGEVQWEAVDLSALARQIAEEIQAAHPERQASIVIADGVVVCGDSRLLRAMLENLLGNAWKFTARTNEPRIEFGTTDYDGERVCFVRDNGVGFDMTHARKLFHPFQRLHRATEFEGTGIGLATVYRIVRRHGGRVWAHGAVGQGATFYFTLPFAPCER